MHAAEVECLEELAAEQETDDKVIAEKKRKWNKYAKGSSQEQKLLFANESESSSEPSPNRNMQPGKPKRNVIVHVTFLKLGEINTLKEQFDADVLVRSKWREPVFDRMQLNELPTEIKWEKYWNPQVFVENKVGDPKLTMSKSVLFENDEAYVLERRRIKGTFMETLELYEFPFDVQDLSINIMSDLPTNEVDLVEDPEEIHKIYKQSFIDEQEWYLYKYIESEKLQLAKDRADPTVRRAVLNVRCRAARRPAYFLFNIFSVTLLISMLAFLSFAVRPELTQNRLQLTFTLILTSVAFKFVVNQSLPRISYLTYLDRYILATMTVLACICLWHGIFTLFDPMDRRTDFIAFVILFVAYFIYNFQFFFRIFIVPYKKRREMKRKEAEYVKTVQEWVTRKSIKQTNESGKSQV